MKRINFPKFWNKAPHSKQRITEGSNVTRPGATIILTQPQRFGIGLDDYMQGIRSFENVDFTQRVRIYDIYSESLMDPHLFSVIQKRKSGVLGRKIEFRRNGMPDDKVNEQISSPWFLRFLEDALDAQYWGFTLVQFYINDKGWIDYYLVPRKHVDPVLRIIKTRQNDITGESFDEYPDLLMIRGKEPLGVLARCAPYVIYKRGTVGDWAQFSELLACPYANTPTMPPTLMHLLLPWMPPEARVALPPISSPKAPIWNSWRRAIPPAAVSCTVVSWTAATPK